MPKKAISVTLGDDNLVWLRGRVGATGGRSVSELLDQLVTHARSLGPSGPARSVVGTIDIDPNDPWLEEAGAAVRAMFDASLGRPTMARETSPVYGGSRRRKKPRR